MSVPDLMRVVAEQLERELTGCAVAVATPAQRILDIREQLVASRERVERERYARDRQAEELGAVNASAAAALRQELANVLADIDKTTAENVGALAAARRQRAAEARTLNDIIDVQQLRASDDPDASLRLVGDARAESEVLGVEARRVAAVRLRQLARAEKNQLNGRAFAVLCKVTEASPPADRSSLEETAARKKTAVTELFRRAARALALGDDALRAPVATATAAASQSRMVVGPYWVRQREEAARRRAGGQQ